MAVILLAILSMLCRTASRSSDIALSCCGSKEGATSSGAFCATGSACGVNQPSCGYEFAIISRAASPCDCQAKVAATPMQKVIRKRTSASKARLTDELTGNESADNSDCVVLGR